MPLHLLGKKSWNVYNVENIEKVRRDEAAAKAKEEDEERRMQDEDTKSRLEQLRTGTPQNLASAPKIERTAARDDGIERSNGRRLKKRKLAGEDDTDRDIRLAKESSDLAPSLPRALSLPDNPSLVDSKGNISLIPENKRAKTNSIKARKEKEPEALTNMRFSDAAGRRETIKTPWYSTASSTPSAGLESNDVGTNVWGKEDSGRAKRDKSRIHSNDPLSFMKTGVQQLKQIEKERRTWRNDRLKDFSEPISEPIAGVSKKRSGHEQSSRHKLRARSRSEIHMKHPDSDRSRPSRRTDYRTSSRNRDRHISGNNSAKGDPRKQRD
ncbi:MAG: hypothetical protein M1814_006907 [Vezdaea aestivalis]|nr:MAG: hypothetical protein M1814_006907 [Vezdaea aestivalis]